MRTAIVVDRVSATFVAEFVSRMGLPYLRNWPVRENGRKSEGQRQATQRVSVLPSASALAPVLITQVG
jgi:hypothetical protein